MSAIHSIQAKCVVVSVLLGLLFNVDARAEIVYFWSGRLELFDSAEPDPWLIGLAGADFTLQTTISSTAGDRNVSDVPFAQFTPNSVRLWIDNQEIDFVADGTIDFADAASAPDTITAGGSFTRLGQTVFITSVVGLPPSTFCFLQAAELPPYFNSLSASALGQAVQHPYVATVQRGALITVVPEPGYLCTALPLMLTAVGRRRLP